MLLEGAYCVGEHFVALHSLLITHACIYTSHQCYDCKTNHEYSEMCLKRHSKIGKIKVLKTTGSFMKVESIAECSLGAAFCNTFDLH